MADKVQKIREEVKRLKSQLLRGACSSQLAMETRCKEEAYNDVLGILDTMQKEPVSEDLEKAASRYAKEEYNYKIPATLPDRCRGCYAPLMYAFKAGANWQKQHFKCPCDCPVFKDGIKVGKEEMKQQMDEYLKDMSNEIDLIGD